MWLSLQQSVTSFEIVIGWFHSFLQYCIVLQIHFKLFSSVNSWCHRLHCGIFNCIWHYALFLFSLCHISLPIPSDSIISISSSTSSSSPLLPECICPVVLSSPFLYLSSAIVPILGLLSRGAIRMVLLSVLRWMLFLLFYYSYFTLGKTESLRAEVCLAICSLMLINCKCKH